MTLHIYEYSFENPASLIKDKISLRLLKNDSSIKSYDINSYNLNFTDMESNEYINLLAYCLRAELQAFELSIIEIDSTDEFPEVFEHTGSKYLGLIKVNPGKEALIKRAKHIREFEEINNLENHLHSSMQNALSNSPNINFNKYDINKFQKAHSRYIRTIKKWSRNRIRNFTWDSARLKRLVSRN